MCDFCDEREALDGEGCCGLCLVHVRIEVAIGMRRIGEYLEAWSAFEAWCEREPAAA